MTELALQPPGYELLRWELVARLIRPLGVLLVAALLATSLGVWLVRRRPRLARLRRGEVGTAELEFAAAFPWFLLSVFIAIQMMLVLNATLVVDYAAFCAARSASVWASEDADEGEKWDRIERAARLATVPISPRPWTVSAVDVDRFGEWTDLGFARDEILWLLAAEIDELLASFVEDRLREATEFLPNRAGILAPEVPNPSADKVATDFLGKYLYTWACTWVRLEDENGTLSRGHRWEEPDEEGDCILLPRGEPVDPLAFEDAEAVTAGVTHHLYVAAPFSGWSLATALDGRPFLEVLGVGLGSDYCIPITARYTMANWGGEEAR